MPIASTALSHPRLYADLSFEHPELFAITNGLRMTTTIIAFAMAIYWASSAWRCLVGRGKDGDAFRAGCIPLAIAVLLFNIRWFLTMTELTQARFLLVAQGGMLTALMVAVYTHGRRTGQVRMGRAVAAHAIAIATCIGISALVR